MKQGTGIRGLVMLMGVLAMVAVIPTSGLSEVPQQINFQGTLNDDGGNPLNGNYTMVFAIYYASTGDSPQWSETQSVAVTNGIFNVQIGQNPSGNPFPEDLFDGPCWMGVRVGSDQEMTPRQPLTSAPFALMADKVSTGAVTATMLADDAVTTDKIADSTITGDNIANGTITASNIQDGIGSGLDADTLDGLQASAFMTAGIDNWVNETGDTMSASSSGPLLNLTNNGTGHAIRINAAGNDGLYIQGTGDDGLEVRYPGDDGVYIAGATDDGVYIASPTDDGLYVYNAGDDGVYVESPTGRGLYISNAGGDGVNVEEAGSPSKNNSSSYNDGFEVTGAQGNGLFVGHADRSGVRVQSASHHGALIQTATLDGVNVYQAGGDGVKVQFAGAPSGIFNSTHSNGFEVTGAEGHGLYVGRADRSGVRVESAEYNGLYVETAGYAGMQVASADNYGVYVKSSGDDGVSVTTAGNPTATESSIKKNGFEVGGAEDCGLYVGRADEHGAYIESAGWNGVHVKKAGNPSHTINSPSGSSGFEVEGASGHGVFVGHADKDGIHVSEAEQNGLLVNSAVVGVNAYGSAYAAIFHGHTRIDGYLEKSSGSFLIDHPLDPENKYLRHSFVESPDMKNIYDGVVTLDDSGEAWIELPEWFEALNRDFRYQLTCIGGFAQVHIAEKIANNTFKIAGGYAGLEVSWQVTGIRQDPFAEANPIAVEEDKPPEEQGTYLHPKVYRMPDTMGVSYEQEHANANEQRDRKGGGA